MYENRLGDAPKAIETYRAVLERDASADGTFCFAVRTTGVYCRPSCGARRPRAENVVFFRDAAAAARAGFRACKRCKPDGDAGSKAGLVVALCRQLESAESTPRLRDLADDEMREGFPMEVNDRKVYLLESDGQAVVTYVGRNRMGYMFMAPELSLNELVWLVSRTDLVGPQ